MSIQERSGTQPEKISKKEVPEVETFFLDVNIQRIRILYLLMLLGMSLILFGIITVSAIMYNFGYLEDPKYIIGSSGITMLGLMKLAQKMLK